MNKPLELYSLKKEPLVAPTKRAQALQDKLVHKAGQILGTNKSKKEKAIVSSIIESDFERDKFGNHAGKSFIKKHFFLVSNLFVKTVTGSYLSFIITVLFLSHTIATA